MDSENEKYNRIIEILRSNTPELTNPEYLEEKIISKISGVRGTGSWFSQLPDILFGWVYITWVRRSLISVSVILVMIFTYQQVLILQQLNYLSSQTISTGAGSAISPVINIEKRLMMFKYSGHRFSKKDIIISEDDLSQLINSMKETELKYRDLLNMIEKNPELKEYVEKKLEEGNRINFKL